MNLPVLGILAVVLAIVVAVCRRATTGAFVWQENEERASALYSYHVGNTAHQARIDSITFSDVVGGSFEVRVSGLGEDGSGMSILLTAEGDDQITENVPPRIKYALGCFAPSFEARAALWRNLAWRTGDLCDNHGLLRVNRSRKPFFVETTAPSRSAGDGTYTRREAMGKAT
jgi:hypothetical protein